MAEEQTYTQGQDAGFEMLTRVRTLEGKYNLLRDRALIINNNMIMQYRKTTSEMKALEEDIKDIKHSLFQIKETLKHLVREMEGFSRKEELRVLEKYINLWNPMKFVTEGEVRRIVEEGKKKKSEK